MLTGMNGTDISRRALSLGRMLDRLQEGEYMLELVKRAGSWGVVVKSLEDDQAQTIRRVEISDDGIIKRQAGIEEK